MIPTYDIENLTGGLDTVFQNIMRTSLKITIIFLTIWLITSLLIWLFGAKKKSETAIKFGVRNFAITLVLIVLTLAVPILFDMFQL